MAWFAVWFYCQSDDARRVPLEAAISDTVEEEGHWCYPSRARTGEHRTHRVWRRFENERGVGGARQLTPRSPFNPTTTAVPARWNFTGRV